MGARVFVYGTLRRGQSNHRLLASAKFVGVGRTAAEYSMFSLGPFPGVVEGGTTSIVGEIYDVGDDTLAALDSLEGTPTMYSRETLVLDVPNGMVVEWYVWNQGWQPGRLLAGGDWLERRTA